jgi:glucose-1-phosphate thymidylyltransferase
MTAAATAIIPVAGVGTRLRPHTHTQPKVLLHVAGKPILAHILDQLPGLGITRAVLIVGYLGDRVREFVSSTYPNLDIRYVDQPEALGLGHAVGLAEPHVGDEPVLVILGDTIFDVDLQSVLRGDTSAIGVKEVADPRRFGIVETNGAGRVSRMIEKPEHPTSNLAIAGLYYFLRAQPLFGALRELQSRGTRTRGEFQLTDGMQLMVDRGEVMKTFAVEGWYDCGKLETLLETNRILLERRPGAAVAPGSVIIPPVAIAPGALIERSVVGPYASIAGSARVRHAIVRDIILNEHAVVEDQLLEHSVVGEHAVIKGRFQRMSVGDSSIVESA